MKRDRAIREAIGMDTKAGTAACAGACMQQRTGVGVADGAAVVRSNVGDAALAKLHAADLAQLVARLLTGDAVHHKAALGVIHQADGRRGQGGRGQGLCCSTCCGAWRWQCVYIRACACPSTATGAFPAARSTVTGMCQQHAQAAACPPQHAACAAPTHRKNSPVFSSSMTSMKPAGYVASVRTLPSTLTRRCMRIILTSLPVSAYLGAWQQSGVAAEQQQST